MYETFRFIACWSNGFKLHLVFTDGVLDEIVYGYGGVGGYARIAYVEFIVSIDTFLKVDKEKYYDKMLSNTLTKDDVNKIAEMILEQWSMWQISKYRDCPKCYEEQREATRKFIETLKQLDVKWKVFMEECD